VKKAFPISLDAELVEWILSKKDNERFRNQSHLVEVALKEYRRKQLQEGVLEK
jgi:hypothetical protein